MKDTKMAASMRDIKEWLIQKCRIPNISVSLPGGKDASGSFGTIVTPQSIPEFVIPGSNDSSRHPSIGSVSIDDEFSHSSENSLPCSAHTSPGISPRSSFSGLGVPQSRSPIIFRSAPVSPRHECKRMSDSFATRSLTQITTVNGEANGDTNADPASKAAMGLSHFKTSTSYGFTTLKEAPHTRRKESLFHAGDLSSFHFVPVYALRKAASLDYSSGAPIHEMPLQHRKSDCPPPTRPTMVNFSCQDDLPKRDSSRRSLKYQRRRSSLPGLVEQNSQDDDDDNSSNENLASCKNKGMTYLSPKDRSKVKRHSSPDFSPTAPAPTLFGEVHTRSSSVNNLLVPGYTFPLKQKPVFGELKFAFHFLPDTRQLKVSLIRGENLGGHHRLDCHVNVFAKLYLMPGKMQKQTSEVTKHSKDPVFNEDIFFSEMSFEGLQKMSLRIKLYNKGYLKPNEYLGELNMHLGKFDLFQENRMWRDIEPKREGEEDLGHLQVSLMLDDLERKLRVTIGQATGLPHHHYTGPPDPYVRVEVCQPGEGKTRKQTRVIRKIADPIFKETFNFDLCTLRQDIIKHISVCITVLDHDRIRTDSVIGQVRLGCDATEESEMNHWQDVIKHFGCEICRWHYILESTADYS